MAELSNAPPVEREHQRLAFEEYFSLGARRTYRQVAEKLGVSPSTIKHWSRTFDWRERIREREADAARQIADRSLNASAEDYNRNRKIVKMAMVRLAKAIAEGKVRMQLGDLDRLIRLESYLSGNTDERYAWIDRETDPEKLRARLRKIMAAAEIDVEDATPDEPDDA